MNIKRRSTGRGRLIESSYEWRAWARESESRTLRGMLPSSPRCGPSRVGYATDRMVMTWLTIARLSQITLESFVYRWYRFLLPCYFNQISPILRQQLFAVEFYFIIWKFVSFGIICINNFEHSRTKSNKTLLEKYYCNYSQIRLIRYV